MSDQVRNPEDLFSPAKAPMQFILNKASYYHKSTLYVVFESWLPAVSFLFEFFAIHATSNGSTVPVVLFDTTFELVDWFCSDVCWEVFVVQSVLFAQVFPGLALPC